MGRMMTEQQNRDAKDVLREINGHLTSIEEKVDNVLGIASNNSERLDRLERQTEQRMEPTEWRRAR